MTYSQGDVKGRLIELAQGVYVERDVLNIAEKIREYDDNLRLQYLDPDHSEAGLSDAPWRVVEICRDGLPRIVLSAWELDDRILERLYAADTQRFDLLAAIDGKNRVVKQDKNRRYQEEREQEMDIITSILKSPKGRYSFEAPRTGNLVTIDDDPQRKATVKEKD